MYRDTRKGPKRGISAYSYSGELGRTMDLEDVFITCKDVGATGIEILANAHIDNYPMPTDAWVDNWYRMCDEYNVTPGEYGHWVDSLLHRGGYLDVEGSLKMLVRDFRIAHRLGFRVLRTKLGVIDDTLSPVPNWKEFIEAALPYAEYYDVCMCPEIHIPTALTSQMVQEYVEFIDKHNTKNFGINVDFGTFQNVFDERKFKMPGLPEDGSPASYPSDLVPLLPYIHACHAKFNHMDENFEETTIPYREILTTLKDNNWDGFMLSEYEGAHKDEPGYVDDQLRKQHIMMKNILGY